MTLNSEPAGAFNPATCRPPTSDEKKGVKGEASFPPLPPSNGEFVQTVFPALPAGAMPLVCSLPDDPSIQRGWPALVADDVDRQCPPSRNNYFNCSSFELPEGFPLSATKDRFAGYHALVLDDVGTKGNDDLLTAVQPTWRLETSPGNFQVGFLLSPPIHDPEQVTRLQHAVAKAGLSDPGAAGLARWMRLPIGINGKSKYRSPSDEPFKCELIQWRPDAKFTLDQVVNCLNLTLAPTGRIAAPKSQIALRRDDEVCTYPKPTNPVVIALRDKGLYKREIEIGKHDITCPWAQQHTDELDTGACYWEPDGRHAVGGFKCQHSHGSGLHIGDLLKHLELAAVEAKNKPIIRIVAGALDRIISAAEEALARTGSIYQLGGAIVGIHTEASTGEIRIEPFTEQRLTRELSKVAVWQQFNKQGGCWYEVDPPVRHVAALFKAQSYEVLPVLRGLARQPYIRGDGKLILEPGYDPVAGIFATFNASSYCNLDATRGGAEAALNALLELLEEFKFATENDRSAALSALLTAALRPSLVLAPAYSITASSPGSGKSYLADLIAAFATPGQPAKASYPATVEEATKAILSHLISGPAALVFDDMTRDWIAFGSINRMLTSETITDRLLGGNRVGTASTRTLVLGTGNNIEPLNDLRRRVVSLRIRPLVANPAMLSYKGRPVERVRKNRDRYVAYAIQIVEAFRQADEPKQAEFAVASFEAWSDLCREPLLWLGLADPANSLREQLQVDSDGETLGELLKAWHNLQSDKPTTLRYLLELAGGHSGERLREAISDLPVSDTREINRSKLGWYLKKNSGRIVDGLMLEPGPSTERRAWRVVTSTPAPPLPPSRGAKVGTPPLDSLA